MELRTGATLVILNIIAVQNGGSSLLGTLISLAVSKKIAFFQNQVHRRAAEDTEREIYFFSIGRCPPRRRGPIDENNLSNQVSDERIIIDRFPKTWDR